MSLRLEWVKLDLMAPLLIRYFHRGLIWSQRLICYRGLLPTGGPDGVNETCREESDTTAESVFTVDSVAVAELPCCFPVNSLFRMMLYADDLFEDHCG